MNTIVENYVNEQVEREYERKKWQIIRVITSQYQDDTKNLPGFLTYKYPHYEFDPSVTREDIDVLYETLKSRIAMLDADDVVRPETYKVKNNWITFIGVLTLIELIAGVIWGLKYVLGLC